MEYCFDQPPEEFQVFGLTNAPAVFQAPVNDVLHEFLNNFAFVYADSILKYSKSNAEHQVHICQVLQQLLENKLFINHKKCEFHVKRFFWVLILMSPKVVVH